MSVSERDNAKERGGSTTLIRSADRVAEILELLAEESCGLPIGEIAARLGLNVSTAHHVVTTLKNRGLVAQDEQSRDYRIGYRLVALVSRFLAGTDLYSAGVGPVEELRDRSGETSYLTAFQGHEGAVVIALTGVRPIQARRVHRPGQSSLHSTATGKTLLAHLPPHELDLVLAAREMAPFTPHTITDREALRDELRAILGQGYALDREEDYVGVECVAVPVFDANGACIAAVSVSYPAAPAERTAELIALVADAAHKVSANLGAPPAGSVDGAEMLSRDLVVRKGA
jgi:DNA-binding IclR family transcriptional regulator